MTLVAGREAAVTRPARPRLLGRRMAWWAEAVLAVLGYELYGLVQAATDADRPVAVRHGWDLIHLEQHLHVWVEPVLNGWLAGQHLASLAADYYYELAHPFVTGVVLGWLWWRRPSAYAAWRNVLLGISLAALLVFWACPVAPPRLTTTALTDTLVRYDALGAAHVHQGLVDLYAAFPSLHVAWACWCAAAVVLTCRSRWRWLAVGYPLATATVVLVTANHYVVDVAAGALLTVAAVALARGPRVGGGDTTTMCSSDHRHPRRPTAAPSRAPVGALCGPGGAGLPGPAGAAAVGGGTRWLRPLRRRGLLRRR